MIYSTSARLSEPLLGDSERPARRPPRAILLVEGRRALVPPAGGTIGRSRDCDIVLADSGVSRRHAAIRPVGGDWAVEDLGSTNGVLLNGREVRGEEPLTPGDVLALGSTEIVFEVG
jgi:pSer/pThr/pTyr-binding forkhead associated (FHA) protein